jgi:hypothetical protein
MGGLVCLVTWASRSSTAFGGSLSEETGMILRGLAGLILGIGYGLFVGVLIWLLIRLTANDPGPMIPDNNGWGQMVALYVTLLTVGCDIVRRRRTTFGPDSP